MSSGVPGRKAARGGAARYRGLAARRAEAADSTDLASSSPALGLIVFAYFGSLLGATLDPTFAGLATGARIYWWGITAASFAGIVLVGRKMHDTRIVRLFALLMAWCVCRLLVGYLLEEQPDAFVLRDLFIMWSFVGCFLVGYYLRKGRNESYVALLAFATLLILPNLNLTRFALNDTLTPEASTTSAQSIIARSVFVLTLGAVVTARRTSSMHVLSIVGICLLFASGARAELFGLAIGLAATRALQKSRKAVLINVGIGVSLIYMWIWRPQWIGLLGNSRAAELFSGRSSSVGARQNFLFASASDFVDRPFWYWLVGEPGRYLSISGPGGYVHNLLSVLASFGLVGLTIFVALFWYSFRSIKLQTNTLERSSTVIVCVAILFCALAAKSYQWPEVAIAWGMAARLITRRSPGEDRLAQPPLMGHALLQRPTRQTSTALSRWAGQTPEINRTDSAVKKPMRLASSSGITQSDATNPPNLHQFDK